MADGVCIIRNTGPEIPTKQQYKTRVRQGSTEYPLRFGRNRPCVPDGTQAGCLNIKILESFAPLYLPLDYKFLRFVLRQMHPAFQRFAMQR